MRLTACSMLFMTSVAFAMKQPSYVVEPYDEERARAFDVSLFSVKCNPVDHVRFIASKYTPYPITWQTWDEMKDLMREDDVRKLDAWISKKMPTYSTYSVSSFLFASTKPFYISPFSDEEVTNRFQQLVSKEGIKAFETAIQVSTPLHTAVECNAQKMVVKMLKRSAYVNSCYTETAATPLICATREGHEVLARKLLVHYDANPNDADVYGNTSLFYAVTNNTLSLERKLMLVEQLLLSGSEITGNKARSPFIYTKDAAIRKLLIEKIQSDGAENNRRWMVRL